MKSILTFNLFIFFLLTFPIKVLSQNLVKNPSFEEYTKCPIPPGTFNDFAKDWYGFSTGQSGYYNSCTPYDFNVPNAIHGFQLPHSGVAFTNVLALYPTFDIDRRSYIEGFLSGNLSTDNLYCVSFFVNLSDNSSWAIKNIDLHLSDTLLDYNNGVNVYLKGIEPQIKSKQIITDSIGWTQISDIYKAKGGEKFVTIGNFLSREKTIKLNFGIADFFSYYFIDDVSVTALNLDFPYLGKDTSLCKKDLPFVLNAPLGYDRYEWNTGDTLSFITVKDSGTYSVNCILTGCGEISDTIRVSYPKSTILNLGSDIQLCEGATFDIRAQSGFTSYLWNTGETTSTISVKDSGNYYVIASEDCTIQIDTIKVNFEEILDLKVDLGNDTTICKNGVNSTITLKSTSSLPNYLWNTGETTAELIVNKKGWYTLESNLNCGVIKSDSIFVYECPIDTLLGQNFPDAFSPNDDNINDELDFSKYNTTISELSIFNRWGEIVYSSNIKFSWDGKFNGNNSQIGVYIYKIKYQNAFGKLDEKRGLITLLR